MLKNCLCVIYGLSFAIKIEYLIHDDRLRRETPRKFASFSRCFSEKMACSAFIELSCYADIHNNLG